MVARTLAISIVLFLVARAASPLAAQERSGGPLSLGLSAGFGSVSTESRSAMGPQVSGMVGIRLSRHLSGVLVLGVFGPEDETPQVGDHVVDERGISIIVRRRPRMLRTRVLLVGVEAGRDGLYLRPAAGLGSHAFAVYGPWPEMNTASKSSEIGPVVGLSAGYAVPVRGRAHVGLEGIVIRSQGEDSSAARTVLGLHVVTLLRL